MRALWVCVGFGLLVQGVGACGSDEHEGSAQAGGSAGKGGGVGGGGVGGAAQSAGGTGHGAAAGSAGTPNTGGASGTSDGGAGGTIAGSANAAGGDESAGAGGVGLGDGGQASSAGSSSVAGGSGASSGSGGSGGASGSCAAATTDKLVFISSAVYTGNLGGLAGADVKCQTLADAARLCGTFKAWLSDDTDNAADRLTHATGNYVLPDGQIVASGWAGLSAATHLHAINVTETKAPAPVGTVSCGGATQAPVWTGATFSGVAVANGSCANWGSSGTSSAGIFGNALATNGAWSGMCQLTTVCASTAALYCIQQ